MGPILLTGATGQVGRELLRTLGAIPGAGEVIAPGRVSLDLSDAASNFRGFRETIRSVKPRWIVNPAAYTAVDKAESEPEAAYAVNALAVQAIGEEAQAIGAGVIHFSTDYVFDGTKRDPYVESDTTAPLNVYGASKLRGEQALAASGAGHLTFRTSWVYGATGKNFLLTVLKLAREREVLKIVADQHGAPTWSADLARMTAAVIAQCETMAAGDTLHETLAKVGGVYHAGGGGATTWYGFAAEAVRLRQQCEPEVRFAEVQGIASVEFPTPAKRPGNSLLDCGRLQKSFGWTMMDWQDSLGKVLSEL